MKVKCEFLKKAMQDMDAYPAGDLLVIVDFGGGEIRLKSSISHCALCEVRLNQEAAFYPFADKFVCAECKTGLATAKAITEY